MKSIILICVIFCSTIVGILSYIGGHNSRQDEVESLTTKLHFSGFLIDNYPVNVIHVEDNILILSSFTKEYIKLGDLITDSSGNSYLINSISDKGLTVQNFDTRDNPIIGKAIIQKFYDRLPKLPISRTYNNIVYQIEASGI